MVCFCSQLIGAGADTTTKLITAAVYNLCSDERHMARLRSNPAEVPDFLEEMLRLEPPVRGMFRVTTEAVEIQGVAIPKGALIWCLYASGNRDEGVFERPDECLPDRTFVSAQTLLARSLELHCRFCGSTFGHRTGQPERCATDGVKLRHAWDKRPATAADTLNTVVTYSEADTNSDHRYEVISARSQIRSHLALRSGRS